VQTPGGCGALRLGAELIAKADPEARIFVGQPTWPNHAPLIGCAGVEMVDYPYYSKDSRSIPVRPDDGSAARRPRRRPPVAARLLPQSDRRRSRPGTVAVGCRPISRSRPHSLCRHRLSGPRQWPRGGRRGHTAGGCRRPKQALVAHSCDKNFGVYRDRVGTLFVKGATARIAETCSAIC
jgi:aromatic-amino-acid transaminase